MDWNNFDSNDERVQLALIKRPARIPITDERYGGAIWLQDGGPGLSGVDFMLTSGKSIQMIVDSSVDPSDASSYDPGVLLKYFDIIAIDSRGLNNSTPCFSCFPTLTSREAWVWDSAAEGILGSSDVSFHTMWARMQAIGRGCTRKAVASSSPGDQLALHGNTTPQIADMVAILELHGKWREREARQQMARSGQTLSAEALNGILDRTKWRENEEMLNFWGFSYGTVVGATFAAMQPHRVGRVVLDGVVDTEDYYTGRRSTNLFGTDTVLKRLTQHCYDAGPERCALFEDGGAHEVLNKLQSLAESLRATPVGVPGTATRSPQLITYSDVISALFNSLYAPIQVLPVLAQALHNLMNANGTSFAVLKGERQRPNPLHLSGERGSRETQSYGSQLCQIQRHSPGDARTAIICADSNTTYGMTQSDFQTYIETLEQQSQMFAGIFAQVRLKCISWELRPSWRFQGPFEGHPLNPMLILGTLADPVTPIRK